jgi:NAD+ synthase (glutamine-hydrolysing)
MKFKLALAQFAPRLGNVDANLELILDLIEQARAQQADLAIFPELALTGYYLKDLVTNVATRPSPDDPRMAPLLAASRQLDLVIGFVEQDDRYQYYIAAVYLSGGRVVHVHRKVYLPTYRLFDDARFFSPGNAIRAFDTRFGRMGLMICEDAWHLSTPYVLWMDGADFLIDIAASPGYGAPAESDLASAASLNAFLRTDAELMTDYVFCCNRVGVEDGISFWGGSQVFDPEGHVIATAPQFEPALVFSEIDTDGLRRARLKLPTLRDEAGELVRRELKRIADRSPEH